MDQLDERRRQVGYRRPFGELEEAPQLVRELDLAGREIYAPRSHLREPLRSGQLLVGQQQLLAGLHQLRDIPRRQDDAIAELGDLQRVAPTHDIAIDDVLVLHLFEHERVAGFHNGDIPIEQGGTHRRRVHGRQPLTDDGVPRSVGHVDLHRIHVVDDEVDDGPVGAAHRGLDGHEVEHGVECAGEADSIEIARQANPFERLAGLISDDARHPEVVRREGAWRVVRNAERAQHSMLDPQRPCDDGLAVVQVRVARFDLLAALQYNG